MAMQLLPRLSKDADAARKEPSAGSRLPYKAQIDRHTLLLRDNRLMQVLHLEGLAFETADTDELNYRKGLRDATLRAIGSSRFALYHHVIRRRVDPVGEGVFNAAFSESLDQAWTKRLRTKELFRKRHLSVNHSPSPSRPGRLCGTPVPGLDG